MSLGAWSLYAIAVGVLLRGTIGDLPAWGWRVPRRWQSAVSWLSWSLISAGLVLGLLRAPVPMRPAATHPATPRLSFIALTGGEKHAVALVQRWEGADLEHDRMRNLAPEDACAQYPKLPLFCAPAGIRSTLDSVLRLWAAEIGAREVAEVCARDADPTLVSDRFDNVYDVRLADSSPQETTLFGRMIRVTASDLNAERVPLVLQDKDVGSATTLEITPGVESIAQYPLGRHTIQFRVMSQRDASGVLLLSFIDIHLKCTSR